MSDPFMVSSYDKTARALRHFAEADRKGSRILLKVVDDGKGHKHLEAKQLSWTSWGTFVDLLFHRTSYKLQSVVSFLESSNFGFDYVNREHVARAIVRLDKKVSHHNTAGIYHIFHQIIHLKQPLDSLYRNRLKDAALLRLETLCNQLFIAYTNVDQLKPIDAELKEFEKLKDRDFRVKCALARDVYDQVVSEIQIRSAKQIPLPVEVELKHIVPQKGDGNCLLRSFAVGLHANGLFDPELLRQFSGKPEDAHALFRLEAVQYLRQHARDPKTPEIAQLLNEAISEHNDAENRKYDLEKQFLEAAKSWDDVDASDVVRELQALEESHKKTFIDPSSSGAYEQYLLLSSQDTFFCTTVHLLALSRAFGVTVELYFTEKTRTLKQVDGLPLVPDSRGTLRLHFDPSGPHYDVIIKQ